MLWRTKKLDLEPTGNPVVGSKEAPVAPSQSSKLEITPQNLDGTRKHPLGAFVVAKGYRVSGTVVTGRPVVVEGVLSGDSLTAPSVSVGPSGVLSAPVSTNSLTVEGVVEQPVVVKESVDVRAGGCVKDDVEAAVISIAPGAIVSGARLAIGPRRAA